MHKGNLPTSQILPREPATRRDTQFLASRGHWEGVTGSADLAKIGPWWDQRGNRKGCPKTRLRPCAPPPTHFWPRAPRVLLREGGKKQLLSIALCQTPSWEFPTSRPVAPLLVLLSWTHSLCDLGWVLKPWQLLYNMEASFSSSVKYS